MKFTTSAQIAEYTSSELIKCLECGKDFSFLGNHLRRTHGITCEEYREDWGIPAMTALAGVAYRKKHSDKMNALIVSGAVAYDHLDVARVKANATPRPKIGVAKSEHAAAIASLRPGDHRKLPPGAKLADGRDADRKREYQQQYRAKAKAAKA